MKTKLILFSLLAFITFFNACQNGPAKENDEPINSNEIYLKQGRDIANATFSVLSGNLQKAMKEGGVTNAVQYCNIAAMPLVDSLSNLYEAQIRRTSSRVRNPIDKPTLEEKVVLNAFEKKMTNGEKLEPIIRSIDDQTIAFYAPIMMMDLCLKCHGKVGETLKMKDYAVIKELYPEDKAIGYVSGDFRGMWSIQMSKKLGSGE